MTYSPSQPYGEVEDRDDDTFDADKIIGMDIDSAAYALKQFGYTLRVTREDGEHYIVTDDYLPNRINVAVENDKIIDTLSIG